MLIGERFPKQFSWDFDPACNTTVNNNCSEYPSTGFGFSRKMLRVTDSQATLANNVYVIIVFIRNVKQFYGNEFLALEMS